MYFSELEQMVKEVREKLDSLKENDFIISIQGEVIQSRVDLYAEVQEEFLQVNLNIE